MVTRAKLRQDRLVGPTPPLIADNRRILFQRALVSAHAVLLDADAAVAAVAVAPNLAAAQAATAALGTSLSDTAGVIGDLLPV